MQNLISNFEKKIYYKPKKKEQKLYYIELTLLYKYHNYGYKYLPFFKHFNIIKYIV